MPCAKCPELCVTDTGRAGAGGTSHGPTASPSLPSNKQNGTLKIIDRKKHIFKLAQGEYIAPEKIENIYVRSEPVAQVFVYGESLQVRALCPGSRVTGARPGLVLRSFSVPRGVGDGY